MNIYIHIYTYLRDQGMDWNGSGFCGVVGLDWSGWYGTFGVLCC
jgi:hypothetical protein